MIVPVFILQLQKGWYAAIYAQKMDVGGQGQISVYHVNTSSEEKPV